MHEQLKPGTVLVSHSNVRYQVIGLLGEGGQGAVYEVDCGGTRKALKWYFPQNAHPHQKKILEALIENGTPSSAFLWPEELIDDPGGKTFGYIMPLRPKRFRELSDLLKGRVRPSFRAVCQAGYNLAAEYDRLHISGNCYRDINHRNMFFDPDTGDVQICDCDNVAPRSMDGFVQGTFGFMAPEVMRGEAKPSRYTDQYSLSVLLFHLFLLAHPLYGAREASVKCLDLSALKYMLADQPLFIYDPQDTSNRPVKGIHDAALAFWPIYPQEIRDLFTESFTTGLHQPHKRVTEKRWMDAIGNLLSSIQNCPGCGAEVFYDAALAGRTQTCWCCRRTMPQPRLLAVGKHRTLLKTGAVIPVHQIHGDGNMSGKLGTVVQNPRDPRLLGIRNDSTDNWTYIRPDGSQIPVAPGRTAAIVKGAKIDFGSRTGEFQ